MKEKIKIGYIGLGRRGSGILRRSLCHMEDVQILYLCDTEDVRLERNCEEVVKAKGYAPKLTHDYREILRDPINLGFVSERPEAFLTNCGIRKWMRCLL